MRCPRCSSLIAEISRECPYCHEILSMDNVNQNDKKGKEKTSEDIQDNNLTYIFTFIPFAGLIYFMNNKDAYPLKSNCALKGFKYNIVLLSVILVMIVLINIV